MICKKCEKPINLNEGLVFEKDECFCIKCSGMFGTKNQEKAPKNKKSL